MTIIEKNMDKIAALCNKHRVSRLFVFGSIVTENFNKSSDIDLLVDFYGVDLYDYADNYFDLKKSLEKLLIGFLKKTRILYLKMLRKLLVPETGSFMDMIKFQMI